MPDTYKTFVNKSTKPILSPKALKEQLPVSSDSSNFIEQSRQSIINVLDGTDSRLLLIVGPCSIHDLASAREYALRLKALSELVSSSFLIVMRTHFEKPRTGLGWKGMVYDPYLDNTYDMQSGLTQARQLLLELATIEVPAATEFLDPTTASYIGDLISWGCIGARTVESQIHRQFVSGLNIPVAFKNNTAGNIQAAVKGVVVAGAPHTFFGISDEGELVLYETQGNPHAHIILRGGELKPNYDSNSVKEAINQLKIAEVPLRLIVDCAHDNSYKDHTQQQYVFRNVLQQYIEGASAIRGLILESHLIEGKQTITNDLKALKYAISLTDPCLDWDQTEHLILLSHAALSQKC